MKDQTLQLVGIFALIAILVLLSQSQKTYANKEELVKALPIAVCNQDSDCVLTTAGTCGGCQTAVNSKYLAIWESTPDSAAFQKICSVVGACVIRSYVARCMLVECDALGGECTGVNNLGVCTAVATS